MAVVKILRNRNVVALEEYIFKGRAFDDPIETEGCFEGSVSEQFISTQLVHGQDAGVDVIHVIQSWSDEDSSLLRADEYTEIGRRMITDLFPGHEFCVVTHTDTGRVHNHIMVNPVRAEDGKRIHNKLRLRHELCAKSDELCLEKGLSIIEKQSRERWERTPDKVREMKRRGGFSWVLDLKEKAKFARAIATSFDEYAGVLNQLGIQVRVENRNVIYHYPGKRQKRGDSAGLGTQYDKAELIIAFRKNYEDQLKVGLKSRPVEEVDFSDHWKFHRKSDEDFVPQYRYRDLAIPPELLKMMNSINLETDAPSLGLDTVKIDEKICLRGREYVQIEGTNWVNTKTGSKGKSLELLGYLKNESWLGVLSQFDTTGKLKKLRQVVSEPNPSFRAFYLPAELKSRSHEQETNAARLLGISAFALQKLGRCRQVSVQGRSGIKLASQFRPKSALTMHRVGASWVCRNSEGFSDPFYKSFRRPNRPLLIFEDPISFLSSGKLLDRILNDRLDLNVVVPMKPLNKFLREDLSKLPDSKRKIVVRPAQAVSWGKMRHALNDDDRTNLERLFQINYRSIDELLKELIIGRNLN